MVEAIEIKKYEGAEMRISDIIQLAKTCKNVHSHIHVYTVNLNTFYVVKMAHIGDCRKIKLKYRIGSRLLN